MITSTKNSRIVEARKLTQRKHRLRQNRFLVEGLQLLAMALEAMTRPRMQSKVVPLDVFYSEERFTGGVAPRLLEQLAQAGANPIPVAPHILDALSDRDAAQGLIATFSLRSLEWSLDELTPLLAQPPKMLTGDRRPETGGREPGVGDQQRPKKLPTSQLPITNYQLLTPNLLLILDRLQDPGNLGTLIRTADAVGAVAVILLEPCVDPFDPKTVRGSMGSLFNVPFMRTATLMEASRQLSTSGYRLVGADAQRGQISWQSDILAGSTALVLGNEARGLSDDLSPYLTDYVSLPLYGAAESLNVAVAGGVLMYEWRRINGGD